MRRAVCPGSFDPPTNGHLDIIGRAASLFDEIVVAVLVNKSKKGLFTVEERIEMLGEIVAPYPNVKVDSFHGLLVDYCRDHDVRAIVKGLRAVTDFDYELQMAQMNQQLSGVDTLFMSTSPEWSFVASSLVKEVATFGGDVAHLLPPAVHRRLVERIAERARETRRRAAVNPPSGRRPMRGSARVPGLRIPRRAGHRGRGGARGPDDLELRRPPRRRAGAARRHP